MSDIKKIVSECIGDLLGPDGESAYHTLVELPPEAVPILIDAYDRAPQAELKGAIVEVIRQFRFPELIPFLEKALKEGSQTIWEHAIDGLVSIGGEESVRALHHQLAFEVDYVKKTWLLEAVEQIRSKSDPDA